jgi:hypothetical protein
MLEIYQRKYHLLNSIFKHPSAFERLSKNQPNLRSDFQNFFNLWGFLHLRALISASGSPSSTWRRRAFEKATTVITRIINHTRTKARAVPRPAPTLMDSASPSFLTWVII